MTHPDYPSRALDRRWRASYKRKARHLVVVFGVAGVLVMLACWAVISRVAAGLPG